MVGERGRPVNEFKGRHYGGEIVLWAVRWYSRYAVSYRDVETMMTERGVAVDHSTICRCVQRYAPESESLHPAMMEESPPAGTPGRGRCTDRSRTPGPGRAGPKLEDRT